MLWVAGAWGFDARNVDVQSEQAFNLTVEAAMQVYKLPTASLVCGFGFSALPDATVHTPYPGFHVGGALEVPMEYGSAFMWSDICWPAEGASPTNAARIRLGGQETKLTQATFNLTLGSYSTEPARMQVEQWRGAPFWLLLGLAMDPWDYEPAELLGCLR